MQRSLAPNSSAMRVSMNKHLDSIVLITLVLCWSSSSDRHVAAQSADRMKHPYASDKPIGEPAIFAEDIVSTGDFDSHPAFTPDGKTLYFLRSTPTFNLWTILVSRFEKGKWGTPEIAPFSGQYSDADPFITSDGARFYFISNRPVMGKAPPDLDIWVMENESFLIFMTGGRSDGRGGFDLYISYNRNGAWTKPANLGDKINSSGNEYSPTISPDGKYYFWTSTRSFADKPLEKRLNYQELMSRLRSPRNGLGDIYQIDIDVLGIGK